MKYKFYRNTMFISFFAFFVCFCGSDESDEESSEDSPTSAETESLESIVLEPPNANSLNIEVAGIEDADSTGLNLIGTNHLAAKLVVVAAKTIILANLVIPGAALSAVQTGDQTYNGNSSWTWTNTFESGQTWTASLTGSIIDSGSTWSMIINSETTNSAGCCVDFQFLTGTTTDTDGTAGTWTVFNPIEPDSETSLYSINWTYVSDTDRSINLTLTEESGNGGWAAGSGITYSINGTSFSMELDRQPSDDATFLIQWDGATKAGSMMNEDGEKVCWDANLTNISCP